MVKLFLLNNDCERILIHFMGSVRTAIRWAITYSLDHFKKKNGVLSFAFLHIPLISTQVNIILNFVFILSLLWLCRSISLFVCLCNTLLVLHVSEFYISESIILYLFIWDFISLLRHCVASHTSYACNSFIFSYSVHCAYISLLEIL